MRVQNVISNKSGRPVVNQFIIRDSEHSAEYFQSYSSIIVKKVWNSGTLTVYLGPDWDYSRTTGKYRNQYLGESTAETRKKLAAGIYKLDPAL